MLSETCADSQAALRPTVLAAEISGESWSETPCAAFRRASLSGSDAGHRRAFVGQSGASQYGPQAAAGSACRLPLNHVGLQVAQKAWHLPHQAASGFGLQLQSLPLLYVLAQWQRLADPVCVRSA